uniref:Uncharacterized protein n=4 Tax=Oryza TaxID=4527 RepID=Q8S5X0_ORYSJ|nr:Hypothetical protein [Oryza sativa Japonica Group]ABF94804.1 hypothetical protein LOC_Os03g12980 [Oryza sativa Japonica Group]
MRREILLRTGPARYSYGVDCYAAVHEVRIREDDMPDWQNALHPACIVVARFAASELSRIRHAWLCEPTPSELGSSQRKRMLEYS